MPAGKLDRRNAGKPAPAVSFTTRDGKSQTLADYRGKPVLVNLWATWCRPCVAEMPALDIMAQRLAGRVTVL
ncbi:MAG: TlpA family protein disulfide reductase, partial [Alphaproteobacteria bacterium]|nr:TlpA family protein disulfide reductase [Alphaproteobacteria bacterium]